MEIDLRADDRDLSATAGTLRSQVCVIGGGVAGLLLAHRLRANFTVTLLEAGGSRRADLPEADPFSAELAGVPHAGTRQGRVRALGGCSLTWGGQLLGFPEDAAWPVSAADLLEAGGHGGHGSTWDLPQDMASFFAANRVRLPGMLAHMPELTPRLSRFMPFSQRNLARNAGRELLASQRVKVVLHACATELEMAETRDRINRITGVKVATPAGKMLRVEADQYILAAGTVQTCRLLLASRGVAREGIGNGFGQVGRNFHDHLTVSAAVFTGAARARILQELRPWVFASQRRKGAVYSMKLEPSAALRERLGLPPGMAHLTIEEPAASGMGLLRNLLRARQERVVGAAWWAAVKAAPRLLGNGLRLVWEARVRRRRYVSPQATVRLQLNLAQDAPSASLVRLSSSRDGTGMPKAVVDWRISSEEMASLRRFAGYMKMRLEAAGIGDGIVWEPSLLENGPAMDRALMAQLDDARHAMGGACMGADPRTSVVDPELRVHGVANLSVASAAVFPDGAAQLPTWTLRALCLRLVKRLERELRG